MFFLSSITPVNKNRLAAEDKFLRNALFSIWGILVIFGVITLIQPKWLKEISSPGIKSEAMDLKYYGDTYLREGNFKSAIRLYTKAVNLQPDLYGALGNLGIAHREVGNYQKSRKIFNFLLEKDTEHIHTNYYNLAELYKKQGQIEEAISYYIKAAEFNPYPIYSYQFLADLYMKLGRWNDAIETFNKALDNRLTLENSYSGLLKIVGKQKGKLEIQNAVKKWQKLPLEAGIYDDSIFKKMLNEDKEIAKIHNFIAVANNKLGNKQQAIIHWEMALKIWPKFNEAKQNLKKIEL